MTEIQLKQAEFILALLKVKNIGAARATSFIINNSQDLNKCINSLPSLLSPTQIDEFNHNKELAKKVIEYNQQFGISITTIFDRKFPIKLYINTQKCVYLFYKGNINLLNQPSVAIIGTRNPQDNLRPLGVELTKNLSKDYVIVSGLAEGCDTIAHRNCLLNKGKTIAVLPSPIFNIIPKSNVILAKEIIDNNGLLVSEYGTNINPKDYKEEKGAEYEQNKRYIERDRIQSILSDAVVVIDSNDKGGTRHAVLKALHDNKPVFQLKGSRMTNIKYIENVNDINQIIKKAIAK